MATKNTPEVVQTLRDLLQAAEMPTNDCSPIILCHQNLSASQITETCVVESCRNYQNDPGKSGGQTITADTLIKHKLDEGFKVMSMVIIQKSYSDGGTEHVLMTVMVKLKTE